MNWIFWLGLVLILAGIEVATVNLLTIWFVLSGIVTLIVSFFIDNIAIQTTIFIILGLIFLITTRPLFNKLLAKKDTRTNLDRVIGMEAIVTEEIKKNQVGEVKVAGKKWSAISKENFAVGDLVIVKKIEGVKLIVGKDVD